MTYHGAEKVVLKEAGENRCTYAINVRDANIYMLGVLNIETSDERIFSQNDGFSHMERISTVSAGSVDITRACALYVALI